MKGLVLVSFLSFVTSQVPEQIHLSFGSSAHSMTVMWVTLQPTGSSDVSICIENNCTRISGKARKWVYEDKPEFPESIPRYMHEVHIKALEPYLVYTYQVGSAADNIWSPEMTFIGPIVNYPGDHRFSNSTSFLVFGDFGTCSSIPFPTLQSLIWEAANQPYDAFFHTGDIAYNLEYFNGVRGDEYMRSIQPFAGKVPYMVVVGNHEKHQNFTHFKHRFGMPGKHENLYYSLNLGPVHILVYSSEVFCGKKTCEIVRRNQLQWMISDLSKAKEERKLRPWIFAFAHKPLYCSADWRDTESIEDCYLQPVNMKLEYEDLLAAYGVDLHFHGHVHGYERTEPIYQGYAASSDFSSTHLFLNPKAPIYLIDGIAGTCRPNDLNLPSPRPEKWSLFRSAELGYSRVFVNETIVKVTHIRSADRSVEDFLYIVKTRNG